MRTRSDSALKVEDIDSKKAIIVEIIDKKTKNRTLGFVQEFEGTDRKITMTVKPLVIKADFEGDPVKYTFETNVVGLVGMIKKFESSQHEVLLVSGNKGRGFMKKDFSKWLESLLHSFLARTYREELQKTSKEHYVA